MSEEDDDIVEVYSSVPAGPSSSSGNQSQPNPSEEIRSKLIEQFVETTKTDKKVASFYLSQFDWDLQVAVPTFLEEFADVKSQFPEVEALSSPKPRNDFSLITWNVDGLSPPNLKIRVKAVCKVIENTQVDIVFLQEVIPKTLAYFKEKLENYIFIVGNEEDESLDYFNIICLRRHRVSLDSFHVIPFDYSVMGRNLLFVEAHVGRARLILMNTHLESTKDHATTRIDQLKQCLSIIKRKGKGDTTVIFGGDLNVRDSEVTFLPPQLHDLWIVNGERRECKYTWDMTRNTNLQFPGRFKPRLRFDRLYIKYNDNHEIKSDFFGLVGIEKISGTHSFPSDHWGILTRFQIAPSSNN